MKHNSHRIKEYFSWIATNLKMQPTWMCNQVQGTEKIKMCHDFYLIYSKEQIYDKGHYIVIFSTFFQFCNAKKKYTILWSIVLIKRPVCLIGLKNSSLWSNWIRYFKGNLTDIWHKCLLSWNSLICLTILWYSNMV